MDYCSNCGVEANDNELYEVVNYDADEIQYVCGHCLEYYTKCDRCGMFRPSDRVEAEPETGRNICDMCSEKSLEPLVQTPDVDPEEVSWRD